LAIEPRTVLIPRQQRVSPVCLLHVAGPIEV
jgi:hypothetical protein